VKVTQKKNPVNHKTARKKTIWLKQKIAKEFQLKTKTMILRK
jgi:hypothetical protein